MDDNYFDPSPSPNLPMDDPLRDWVQQVQSDPQLANLMTTDPQGAMNRMKELGIPPPPQGFMAYTDGMAKENDPNAIVGGKSAPLPGQVIGGATPPAASEAVPLPAARPAQADGASQNRSIAERLKESVGGMFPTFGQDGKLQGNLTSAQGQPPAPSNMPPILEPEENPSRMAGVPTPRPNANRTMSTAEHEAGGDLNPATDVSSSNKKANAFDQFAKSLQGIKPVPPPAPNFVGTPSVRSPNAGAAPNLTALLSLVGQAPAPMQQTLGRLLATGKA